MRISGQTFFTSKRAARAAGFAVAAAFLTMLPLAAQQAQPAPPPATTQQDAAPAAPQAATPAPTQDAAQASATISNTPDKKKKKVAKADRVVQTKDTRREIKKDAKLDPLAGKDAALPDKALYDKALAQTKSGHYDVARLDLQTLLNTYPDSQYQMRAKLAIADAWYREGGSAALTQAEQEYNDFITFFPNVPEAAEAQMRVGDIYFKQMDVPDRDYSKAVHAEEAYRLMLKQYADGDPKLVDEARQKLREVQEVLATREADLGAFYATHENWPASIARLQTVADTYPLFSHMDDVLIGIGDAYEAEARLVRLQKQMPEGPKAKLLEIYDGKAAAAYRKVVLEHSAAQHVEDAKERLVSMNLPVPTPTPEQAAASEALEGSRAQYTFQKRMMVLLMRKPDTVTTAHTGEAPLDDAQATFAPGVTKELVASFNAAIDPNASTSPKLVDTPPTPGTPAPQPVAVPNTPLALQEVAGPGEGSTGNDTSTMTEAAPATGGARGNSLGVEVLTPGATVTPPAATGAPDPNYGLKAVGPANTAALPPVEKAADAPDQVNEAAGKPQPPAPAATGGKKTKKPVYDKDDESSSKKKPKKGLDKLNPF
jgi:outer membrane protein assembly factor BamD